MNDEDTLAKAIRQLRNQQAPPGPTPQLVQDTLGRLAEAAKTSTQGAVSFGGRNAPRLFHRWTQLAAAAVLLLAAGFTVGRLYGPGPVDVESLRRQIAAEVAQSLQPMVRDEVRDQMNGRVAPVLVEACAQLKAELTEQSRQDLNRFAVQTLAASNSITNQLLAELLQTVKAEQTSQLRAVAAALNRIEASRLADRTQLATGLETLAYQTEDELRRTKQDIVQLLSYSPPDNPTPDKPRNSNNPNERDRQ